MAAPAPLERIARVAEEQWGLITRQQALDAGVPSRTLVRLGAQDSVLRRVAHGVYLVAGAPEPDHLGLRAAWLQLAPQIPAWKRTPADGVVSHRSAAAMYGLGHLPADVHEFTASGRRRSRRDDVRIHRRVLDDAEWIVLRGLPVTRPSRIASDLLYDGEEPASVGQLIADSLRPVYDYPGTFAEALAPHAVRMGLRRGDGLGLLRWLLELVGDPNTAEWIRLAQDHVERTAEPRP
jgi:hypothetical protein